MFAGRLVENKGIDHFVRLVADNPGLYGQVLGTGSAETDAKQLASSLGCADRVRFFGHVDDVMNFLAAADVFAIPTRNPTEGRPLAVLEALAVGTPVIGTTHGVLVTMRDAEGLPLLLSDSWNPFPKTMLDAVLAQGRVVPPLRDWDTCASEVLGLG